MKDIKGDQLIKQYGEGDAMVTAVRHASFEIAAGEFVAIVGESGSGKSTLLSMVGALNTPTSGRLTVDNIDVYGLGQDERADFRRETLGFVFQSFHLIPYLTLAENVMLPLATRKEAKKEKRSAALHALDRVGLSGKGERLPNQISGGEQERVAIARAIVNRPAILLADEPTGNLDSRTGKEIMELIEEFNSSGGTVVMVTHNSEYTAYAGRVLKVVDGVIA
ncbi:MAG TPA: ABC transporter ATP-binding protein [Syntrophorhabdaceae bacterium]|jgi:putative ABC transport system ATP-binding protein